ncbi:MAG: hypothetical protein H5U07_00775 [Candidatus Aminicenantes bacterium]|nr:hypothetical protein [Candidatus Aminicenantes bacterium]
MNREKGGKGIAYSIAFRTKIYAAFFLLICLTIISCSLTPRPVIPAGEIKSLKAEGSFFYRGEAGQGRSRLLLYLQAPDQIRLEIFNPLGGLAYIIWFNDTWASLYLPGQKVFWEGETQVLTAEFLGGVVTARELVCLFSGRLKEFVSNPNWHLFGKEAENFYAGQKGDWRFEVKEFFQGGEIPRTIYFEKPGHTVRLRILKIRFNQLFQAEVFIPSYTSTALKLSWEEISRLWKK